MYSVLLSVILRICLDAYDLVVCDSEAATVKPSRNEGSALSTNRETDSEWLFDTIGAYYDEQHQALATFGAALEDMEAADRPRISQLVSERVTQFSALFNDEQIVQLVVSMVDDLYRAGSTISAWGEGFELYVAAVWGTMFNAVQDRGLTVRYIVENTWPDDQLRPVQFFPAFFGAAGITYVCPSFFASQLPELEGAPLTADGLRPGLAEGRLIAKEVALQLAASGRQFAYFETDFDDGCLDSILELPKPRGTIQILRNQAPIPGSTVELTFVE